MTSEKQPANLAWSRGIRYQFDLSAANAPTGFGPLVINTFGQYRFDTLLAEVLDVQTAYVWDDLRCLYIVRTGLWVNRWQALTEAGELWLMTNQPPEALQV